MNPVGSVLVVDDNDDNRDLLARILVKQGHSTSMANNGLEAINAMKKDSFDLILLDVMMPVMGGIEALRQIKEDPELRHVPIIIVSAIDDIDNVVTCIELGAEDYLFKPVNKVLLNARVFASLEKKRLRDQEQLYMQHVKEEFELGRQIQADFLPGDLPQLPGWDIDVSFYPAFEVAGDFYDVFMLGENKLCLVIADVCGKGIGAAIFMALVRSLIRAFAEQGTKSNEDILHAVDLTNSYIIRHHRQKKNHMFATLFFGVLDTQNGDIDYVTAGHYPPLIIAPTGDVSSLELCAPAVGIMGDTLFPVKHSNIPKGSTFFAFTDGVIEAKNETDVLFSEETLLSILNNQSNGVHAILKRVEKHVRAHTGSSEPSDDITMLAVHRS